MDEATALIETLGATPPSAPTACAGWTAHELVAHLAAGAAEMADLTEATVAGRPSRATRAFADREAPFVVLPDDELRDRLLVEALRLGAAVESLGTAGPDAGVDFAGRRLTAADLSIHGRSEAALHRWDLVGDDEVSRDLLGQPELSEHAVAVLTSMLDGSPEAISSRFASTGVAPARLAFASPGQPDVVFVRDEAGSRLELADPGPAAAASADPATRLLALWGRRSQLGPIRWGEDPEPLVALLWSISPG